MPSQGNRGRGGNFGNPEQHAEAGRQSSGNRGNPQQHAEAGRQSGGNRGGSRGQRGGNEDGGEEGEGQEEEGSSVAQMNEAHEQDTESRTGSIEQLRGLMQQIQQDKEYHTTALNELNQGLEEIKGEIDQMMQEFGQDEEGQGSQGPDGGGRGQGGRSQQGSTKSRGGRESGTQVVLRLLQENKGRMLSTELRDAAEKEGIKSPYSSIYQLTKSGRISREGDRDEMVVLSDENDGGGGRGRGGNRSGGNRGGSK